MSDRPPADLLLCEEARFCFADYVGQAGRLITRAEGDVPVLDEDLQHVALSIPCFTPGSMIDTAAGTIPVADLRVGMQVVTHDNGLQTIRWIGVRSFGWRNLGLLPFLRPVRVAAGALGPGVPARDMLVSPNHRLLTLQAAAPGEEGLAEAADFLGRDGVTRQTPDHVDYVQILCDRHELLRVDGCWSESFQPRLEAIRLMTAPQRRELTELLSDQIWSAASHYAAVRGPVAVTEGLNHVA